MGNTQQQQNSVPSVQFAHPYDDACDSIEQTLPLNFVQSYGRVRSLPKAEGLAERPTGASQTNKAARSPSRRSSGGSPPTGDSPSRRGSPGKARGRQTKSVKKAKESSYWNYGEYIGAIGGFDDDISDDSRGSRVNGVKSRTTSSIVDEGGGGGDGTSTTAINTVLPESMTTFSESVERPQREADSDKVRVAEQPDNPDEATSVSADKVSADSDATKRQRETNKRSRSMKRRLARQSEIMVPVYGHVDNHKPFLEPDILNHFLPFILDQSLSRCFAVCPHWLHTIQSHLRKRVEPVVRAFKRAYCQPNLLGFESFSINIQPLFTADRSAVRIDLLIYSKVSVSWQGTCCTELATCCLAGVCCIY